MHVSFIQLQIAVNFGQLASHIREFGHNTDKQSGYKQPDVARNVMIKQHVLNQSLFD